MRQYFDLNLLHVKYAVGFILLNFYQSATSSVCEFGLEQGSEEAQRSALQGRSFRQTQLDQEQALLKL